MILSIIIPTYNEEEYLPVLLDSIKEQSFTDYEIISATVPDNRNMVLFPEKIGGYYYRLERPFPVYSRGVRDRFDMWISKSPDLKFWGESKMVMAVEHVPFANDKIGPAAPPIKTEKGWLIKL